MLTAVYDHFLEGVMPMYAALAEAARDALLADRDVLHPGRHESDGPENVAAAMAGILESLDEAVTTAHRSSHSSYALRDLPRATAAKREEAASCIAKLRRLYPQAEA